MNAHPADLDSVALGEAVRSGAPEAGAAVDAALGALERRRQARVDGLDAARSRDFLYSGETSA